MLLEHFGLLYEHFIVHVSPHAKYLMVILEQEQSHIFNKTCCVERKIAVIRIQSVNDVLGIFFSSGTQNVKHISLAEQNVFCFLFVCLLVCLLLLMLLSW